jgi:hypothetical protein
MMAVPSLSTKPNPAKIAPVVVAVVVVTAVVVVAAGVVAVVTAVVVVAAGVAVVVAAGVEAAATVVAAAAVAAAAVIDRFCLSTVFNTETGDHFGGLPVFLVNSTKEMCRQNAKAPRKEERMARGRLRDGSLCYLPSPSSWRLGVLAAHFYFFDLTNRCDPCILSSVQFPGEVPL